MSEPLIVVPLDGSDLSETAVPYGQAAARVAKARLLLVIAWEGAEQAAIANLPDLARETLKPGEEHCKNYIASVSERVRAEGLEVETEVLAGRPAEAVLRVLEQRNPRLLVMATHGRSGPSRWFYGSVASTLVREAPAPTMVVGPKVPQGGPPGGTFRRILVPLDGSRLGESALPPALELAEALDAAITLVQVVPWVTQTFAFGVPDVDAPRLDADLMQAASEYLGRMKDGLSAERKVKTTVLRGLPAEVLIDLVEAERIDIVVMASHTRRGLVRAALGSVADRMLQGKAPVLLVRPETVAGAVGAPRGRYCHSCGRTVAYREVTAEDRCIRCGQHLHTCANCVYFDGIRCLVERPEAGDTYPGLHCPEFQYRETEGAKQE